MHAFSPSQHLVVRIFFGRDKHYLSILEEVLERREDLVWIVLHERKSPEPDACQSSPKHLAEWCHVRDSETSWNFAVLGVLVCV